MTPASRCYDADTFGPGHPDPDQRDDAPEALQSSDGEAPEWTPEEWSNAHRFWWTTRHLAVAPKTIAMDMDALQRLFLELQGREEKPLRELRYVLCLLLMRKKRVKLERILREEGGESFIVRRPKTEERYTVEVFDFTKERMAEIREHLQAIFDGVDSDEALAAAARGEALEGEGTEEDGEPSEPSANGGAEATSDLATADPQGERSSGGAA